MFNFTKKTRFVLLSMIVTFLAITSCGELEKSDDPRVWDNNLNNKIINKKENSKLQKSNEVNNESNKNQGQENNTSNTNDDLTKESIDKKTSKKDDINKDKSNSIINAEAENKEITSKSTSKPTSKQTSKPTSKPTSKQTLEKNKETNKKEIKSKRESWYITLNTDHKPTLIPNYRKELLKENNAVYIGDTSSKNIYLTFDIGTVNEHVETILNTLKEKKVRTIFFITSEILNKKPDILLRMIEDGHAIGNHTMSHKDLTTLTEEDLEYELKELDRLYYGLTNQKMEYFRTPFGVFDAKTLQHVKKLGYKTAFWSYAFNDYDESLKREPKFTYNKIMANYHDGAILLLHAGAKCNADDLPEVIDGLRAKGYSLPQLDL